MDKVCPGCRKTIPDSTLPEGKAVCPFCKHDLASGPDAAPPPKKAPERDLFTDVMGEMRHGAPARAVTPPPPGASPRAAASLRDQTPIPAPPRPARARPRSAAPVGHHRGAHLAMVVGILVVIGAGYLAVMHIRKGIREDAISNVLRQVEYEKTGVEQILSDADKARDAKEYASAATGYQKVVNRSGVLLDELHQGTSDLSPGTLATAVRNLDSELSGFVKRAKAALEIPEVKYGAKKMVQLDDGSWVTPEEKQKRFEERMKAEGRSLYEATGEWLTADETMERKGYVQYIGPAGTPQWVTKEEYARLMATRTTTTTPATPTTPATTTTTLPRPRPPVAKFDPVAKLWMIDDFQSENTTWTPVPWGKDQANPCTLAVEKQGESFKLAVTLEGGPKDKAAIARSLGGADFSSRSKLVFDLFNATGEPIKVAIALETAARPAFFESRWQMLRVDNNEGVKVDLRAGDFKSQSTGWTYAAAVNRLDSVGFLYIMFYTDKPGKVYLDNISALGQ